MPLTTAYPPAAGTYWMAAIYAAAELTVAAQYSAATIAQGDANLRVSARYRGMPPQVGILRVSARYQATAGTAGAATAVLKVKAGYVGSQTITTSGRITVHAKYAAPGVVVERLAPPTQLNVAVTRAATI